MRWQIATVYTSNSRVKRSVGSASSISKVLSDVCHSSGVMGLDRPTGRTSVAAVNEASDVEQRLILLCVRPLRNTEGDPEGTLRMILCWAALQEPRSELLKLAELNRRMDG